MGENRRIQFNNKMAELHNSGLFPSEKRRIVQPGDGTFDCYLIISYGGTGANALKKVKETFLEDIDSQDVLDYVRFLAIDTDTRALNRRDEQGHNVFDASETLYLNNDRARSIVERNFEQVADWMAESTKTYIRNHRDCLIGHGASSMRQISRLTLFHADTVNAIVNRINGIITGLTDGKAARLHVMILAGIAGGTGSGTVIDLTYLIRSIFEDARPAANDQFAGFVFLPPVGAERDTNRIKHGNTNGYAALKEINHFMGNAKPDVHADGDVADMYNFTLGGRHIISSKNIFDICYLLDGHIGSIPFASPEVIADKVLAECLLDMICSFPSGGAQAVSSFLADRGTFMREMVAGKTSADAPRDCDYVYCALGHAEVDLPSRLIKTYVAAKIFEIMYGMFRDCENVSDSDVEEFFNTVKCDRSSYNKGEQKKRIEAEIATIFKRPERGGPFYLVNLLKKASDLCEEYINHRPRFSFTFPTNDQLSVMCKEFRYWNNKYFKVYSAVMTTLSEQLHRDAGLISEGRFGVAADGSENFTFTPIDLTNAAKADTAVKTYLRDIIERYDKKQLAKDLLDDMWTNQRRWTELFADDDNQDPGVFDGVKAIRDFWKDRINNIVGANLEDIFVKQYYKGADGTRGNATVNYRPNPNDPNDPAAEAIEHAAEEIFNHMFGEAGMAHPMVELNINGAGLTASSFTAQCYLFVPDTMLNLLDAIQAYANLGENVKHKVKVFRSTSSDKISAYSQYTSIPAFMLSWACRAEPNYEMDLGHEFGMHMSETPKGKLWKEFPNLIPKSAWNLALVPGKPKYQNPREATIAERASNTFNAANRLGLTDGQVDGDMTKYSVITIEQRYRPEDQLYKDIEFAAAGAGREAKNGKLNDKVEECAQALFRMLPTCNDAQEIIPSLSAKGVRFTTMSLNPAGNMLHLNPDEVNTDADAANRQYEQWSIDIAGCMLRKLPDTMNDLRGTVAVITRLKELIEDRAAAQQRIKYFASYLAAGLFTFNADDWRWEYVDNDGLQQVLHTLRYDNQVEKTAEYYFMFKEFTAEVQAALAPRFTVQKYPQNQQERQQIKDFKTNAAKLFQDISTIRTHDPANPRAVTRLGSQAWANAAGGDMDVDAVRSFYKDLQNTLESITQQGVII